MAKLLDFTGKQMNIIDELVKRLENKSGTELTEEETEAIKSIRTEFENSVGLKELVGFIFKHGLAIDNFEAPKGKDPIIIPLDIQKILCQVISIFILGYNTR